jgi:hypothetical protein
MPELSEIEYIHTLMADLDLNRSNTIDELIQKLEKEESEDD